VTAEALVVAEEADQVAPEAEAIPTTQEEGRTATPPVVITDVAPANLTPLINAEDVTLVAMPLTEIEEAPVTKEAAHPLAVEAAAQALETTAVEAIDLPQMTVRASALTAPTVPPVAREVPQDASSEDQDQEINRQEETAHQRPRAPLKTRR
jgi:hypothetical protein